MEDTRFIEEQIKTYYFVAKTMICEANLGVLGMVSNLEKILDSVYVCDDFQQMDKLISDFDVAFNKKVKKIDAVNYSKESVREVVDRGLASSGSLYNKQEIQGLLNKSLVALPSTGRMISHCFYRMVSLRKRYLEGLNASDKAVNTVVDFGNDILEEKRKEDTTVQVVSEPEVIEAAEEDIEILDFDEEFEEVSDTVPKERDDLYDDAIAKLFDDLEASKADGKDADYIFNNFNKRLDEIDNEVSSN